MLRWIERQRLRLLAAQFARPGGWIGRWLVAPWLDCISARMNALALERLDVRPEDRVLEVGFGGGGLLEMMRAAHPAILIGVDASPDMVARAGARSGEGTSGGRIELHCASAESLPLPDGAVDKAVSVNSLYFWPDLPGAFAELARVLRPRGRLVLCFEPPEELRKWPGHRFGFALHDVADVVRLATAAGFTDHEIVSGVGRKPDRFHCLTLERA